MRRCIWTAACVWGWIGGKEEAVGPGLNFNADDDFLGDGAKPSNLPDFSDLDKQLQQEARIHAAHAAHAF